MGVFGAVFGRRGDAGFKAPLLGASSGVAGFNGCCSGACSGDGGFLLACISGCRGVIGFKVPMGGVLSAKKFALLGLVWVRARKSSPCERKMAQNRRFLACGASFFAETWLEGVCWASFFANQQPCDPVGQLVVRRSPGRRSSTGSANPSMCSYTLWVAWWAARPGHHPSG